MRKFIFDIECWVNYWLCSFLSVEDKTTILSFQICHDLHIDDRIALIEFLDSEPITLIGFNNLSYDYGILDFVYNYSGSKINKETFELSKKIIGYEGIRNIYSRNYLWNQIDCLRIPAFDKAGIGLKQIAVNLKRKRIQGLDIPFDAVIKSKDIDKVLEYNLDDCFTTLQLYEILQPEIKLREELSLQYNVDLTNASNSKIANTILEDFYIKEGGVDIDELHNQRTVRKMFWLKDCVAKNISFKTKKLQILKHQIDETFVIDENGYEFAKKLDFGGKHYRLGIGGLHSDDDPGVYAPTNNSVIIDADCNSFYPYIIINNNIIPSHLDNRFIDVLSKITKERIEAKKAKNTTKKESLKITVNSIFGKLKDDNYWLYDPKAFMSVTISGQLYLLMLIEAFVLAGIEVISGNTDGITCRVPRKLLDDYNKICEWWQGITNFELERNEYELYVRRDVNNYFSLKADCTDEKERLKMKGCFLKDIDLKHGYAYPIVAQALYKYYTENIPVEKTLHSSTDILDFCISKKAGKDLQFVFRKDDKEIPLQRTNRFFISKSGGKLVKVGSSAETDKELGLFVDQNITLLNDLDDRIPFDFYDINWDFYISEAHKILDSIAEFKDAVWDAYEEVNPEPDYASEEFINEKLPDIVAPRFRHSQYAYVYDKTKNIIWRGIGNIKYVNEECANDLYAVGNNKELEFKTFLELLIYLEENYSINSRQMEVLIHLNFFVEFGSNKTLMNLYKEFTKGKCRYDKKLKSKHDRVVQLKYFQSQQKQEEFSIPEQLKFEKEYLNTFIYTNPKLDKHYVYITSVNTKYSPRISAYCLATGKIIEFKIQKGIFEKFGIAEGDIVKADRNGFEERPAYTKMGDDWIASKTKNEWWMTRYKVLLADEIVKL